MVVRKQKTLVGSSQRKPKAFIIISFTVLALYIVYEVASNVTLPSFFERCPDEHFVRALIKHATPDRYIILALVDSSFIDMAVNLVKMSFEPNAIDNFLFVGANRESCEILRNESLPCHQYTEDKAASVASKYNSPDFIRKMNIRTEMILDALAAGFNVVHTDLDVVFFQNPLPELKVIMEKSDFAALWDSIAYNAGFTIIKPTWYSKKVYQHVKSITDYSSKTDDQSALNTAVSKIRRAYETFKVSKLDPSRYLCGLEYFEKGNRLFPSQCNKCMVMHNNWIVSKEAKVYRFKEHLMWMYNKDGYYSNSSTNYITYSNPITWPSQKVGDMEELEALKGALALSRMLNRKLIIPRFHCPTPSVKSKKTLQSLLPKNASTNYDPKSIARLQECPLNSLLNISGFDKYFENDYRESSFLKHPLVPDDVKYNKSKEIVIITLVNAGLFQQKSQPTVVPSTNLTNSDDIELIDMSSKQIVDEDDVKNALSSFTEKVLVFRSLYRLSPKFSKGSEQTQFQNDVKSAFKRLKYQQLR